MDLRDVVVDRPVLVHEDAKAHADVIERDATQVKRQTALVPVRWAAQMARPQS